VPAVSAPVTVSSSLASPVDDDGVEPSLPPKLLINHRLAGHRPGRPNLLDRGRLIPPFGEQACARCPATARGALAGHPHPGARDSAATVLLRCSVTGPMVPGGMTFDAVVAGRYGKSASFPVALLAGAARL